MILGHRIRVELRWCRKTRRNDRAEHQHRLHRPRHRNVNPLGVDNE